MIARVHGWIPDPAHAPIFGGNATRVALAMRGGISPASASIPFGEVFDQGQSGSCVAQASAKCLELVTGVRPSRLAIYEAARVRGGQSIEALRDVGCIPALAVEAMTLEGVSAEERWAFDPAKVLKATPWDVLRADVKVGGWAKLEGPDQVRAALASGHPVMFGMPVDEAFESYAGGLYPGRSGASLGGHMQTIVGYSSDAFRVLNSWGTGWGHGGCSWIAEAYLFGGEPSDFYVLGAP